MQRVVEVMFAQQLTKRLVIFMAGHVHSHEHGVVGRMRGRTGGRSIRFPHEIGNGPLAYRPQRKRRGCDQPQTLR